MYLKIQQQSPPVNSPRMGRSAEICKDEATMFHIKAWVCSYGLYEGIIADFDAI